MGKILYSCMLTIITSTAMAATITSAAAGGSGSRGGMEGVGSSATTSLALEESNRISIGGTRRRAFGEKPDGSVARMMDSSADRAYEYRAEVKGYKPWELQSRKEEEARARVAEDAKRGQLLRPEKPIDYSAYKSLIELSEGDYREVKGAKRPIAGEKIDATAKDMSTYRTVASAAGGAGTIAEIEDVAATTARGTSMRKPLAKKWVLKGGSWSPLSEEDARTTALVDPSAIAARRAAALDEYRKVHAEINGERGAGAGAGGKGS